MPLKDGVKKAFNDNENELKLRWMGNKLVSPEELGRGFAINQVVKMETAQLKVLL